MDCMKVNVIVAIAPCEHLFNSIQLNSCDKEIAVKFILCEQPLTDMHSLMVSLGRFE